MGRIIRYSVIEKALGLGPNALDQNVASILNPASIRRGQVFVPMSRSRVPDLLVVEKEFAFAYNGG
jgi:hypothetical protein